MGSSVRRAFTQIFSPFSNWNEVAERAQPPSIEMLLVSSIQSVCFAVFLSFFVIALRWRFKKD